MCRVDQGDCCSTRNVRLLVLEEVIIVFSWLISLHRKCCGDKGQANQEFHGVWNRGCLLILLCSLNGCGAIDNPCERVYKTALFWCVSRSACLCELIASESLFLLLAWLGALGRPNCVVNA